MKILSTTFLVFLVSIAVNGTRAIGDCGEGVNCCFSTTSDCPSWVSSSETQNEVTICDDAQNSEIDGDQITIGTFAGTVADMVNCDDGNGENSSDVAPVSSDAGSGPTAFLSSSDIGGAALSSSDDGSDASSFRSMAIAVAVVATTTAVAFVGF